MTHGEDQSPKDVRLLLLRRLLNLQAGLIVAGVFLITLLVGTTVYFNARLSRIEQQINAGVQRPVYTPEAPAFYIRPQPSAGSQPTVAARKTISPISSQPVTPPGGGDQVAALLRDLSALVKAGANGQPELSDKKAAHDLATRLDNLLTRGVPAEPQLQAELCLSRVWLAVGAPEKALVWAEAAGRKGGKDPVVLLHLASIKAQLRDWAGAAAAAQEVLNAAVHAHPRQQAEARLLLGQSYRGLHQLDQAAQALAEAVSFSQSAMSRPGADKESVPAGLAGAAALEWSEVLLDLSRYDQALAAAETAQRLGGDAGTADALRGEALVRLNRYAEALAVLKPAAAKAGGPSRILLFLGIAQLKTNDPQAAATTLEMLEKLRPEWNLAYHWRGVTALAVNQLTEAREHLSKAVALQPNYGPSWESLGLAQLNSNQVPQAVESLQQAVELPDSSGNAGLFLALAYTRQNMTDAARTALERAIQKDPALRERAKQIAPLAGLLSGPATQK